MKVTNRARDVRLTIEQVPLTRLRPFPGNPRTMPAAEMQKLVRSIQQFGMVEPLVVRRSDQLVIGGNQRLEAARSLALQTVPVVFIQVSDAEAKTLNVALNKIQGTWDLPRLGDLLAELTDLPGLDETLTGFDPPEIDSLLAELERDAAPSPREASFPQAAEALQDWAERAPTRVSTGDLWRLGRHRLFCGDSLLPGNLEQLTGAAAVDMTLTDAPYGLDYQSSQAAPGRRKRKIANDESSGFEAFLERALPAIKGRMKKGAVLYWFASGGGPSTALAQVLLAVERHFDLWNLLCWDRVDPGLGWRFRRSWEAIVEASVGRPRVWHGGTNQRNVLRFPRAIPQAGVILDPFAGSGSTLIAAERTGRVCLAAEIEPRYCDITVARWEACSGSTATIESGSAGNRAGKGR